MDIWAWLSPVCETLVERGEGRFVERLRSLSHYVCQDDHAVVDALVPELLAEAKRIDHPWLEVFIRHWDLQSRILRRGIVDGALDDAVRLLDLTAREECRDCPQSVCAVQDLACGYGFADGPGFAPERLEVTRETLERIDPSWPCFVCISAEQAKALRDAGRPEEALAFLEAQEAHAQSTHFDDERALCLLQLGRPQEALKLIDTPVARNLGRHGDIERRLLQARTLAEAGRAKEALDRLPDLGDEVAPTPVFYPDWIRVAERLAGEDPGVPNDSVLDDRVAAMCSRLASQGALRLAFEAARARVRLALARGQKRTAEDALEQLEAVAGELKRPLDAPEIVAAARAEVEAAPEPTPPSLAESPEAILAELPDDRERAWPVLVAASERWPASVEVAATLGQAARTPREGAIAIARAEAAARAGRGDDRVIVSTWGHLVWSFQPEQLDAWAEARHADGPEPGSTAEFVLGRRAEAEGRPEEARAHYEAVLAHDPDARNTRRALAGLLSEQGELAAALDHLDDLDLRIENPEERRSNDWTRVVLATRLERWDRVRALATALELEFDAGEGPIREAWHEIRLRYAPPFAEATEVVSALRTGPVTAEVRTIAPPWEPMRYREEVVFDPAPVSVEEQEDGESIATFPVVEVTAKSRFFSFFVEGKRPEAAVLDRLETDLRGLGAGLARVSTDEWEIHDGSTDRSEPGFYWLVALPEDADLAAAHAALAAAAAEVDGVMAWRDLAERRGDAATIAAQTPIMERWALL